MDLSVSAKTAAAEAPARLGASHPKGEEPGRPRRRPGRRADAVLLAPLLAVAVLGRRPGYLLSHAFWLDEAWVAASVRAPLRQLPMVSSSTPIGWALLLLWLGARLASGWSRRRLVELCLACVPALLVSHVTVFASAAVLGALGLCALARRRWDRLAWLVPMGLGVALAQAVAYLAFAAAGDNAAMQRYWTADFVPLGGGLGPAASFVADRATEALGRVGLGPWPLAAAAVACGLAALWRGRLPVVVVAVALLGGELVAAGALARFPFPDERTSLFFATLLTVRRHRGRLGGRLERPAPPDPPARGGGGGRRRRPAGPGRPGQHPAPLLG